MDELPHLSDNDKHARVVVDAYFALRREAGIKPAEAVAEFVRETSYTWANRLLALRCMEARELIDEVILQKEVYGGRSLEHHRLAQRQPELCTGEDDGLVSVLDKIFSERAPTLPLLFDPKAPGVALKPTAAALKRCVALLSGAESVNGQNPATNEVFKSADALGWAYQYWNTEEKARVFEKVRTRKGAKIEGSDIIPATQLYTEPYMVKFLVQNSLGATWVDMWPDTKLTENWEYFVRDADRAPVEKKPVREITFLDPACGSGHFLIEAFDLFYAMYEEESDLTEPEYICRSILGNNLYGIDIDERAVQIAEAAMWMKAAEKAFNFVGAPTNLIATNIRLPKGKDHLKAFLKQHTEDEALRPALEVIFEGLEHANEIGSLLQIEKPVEKELRYIQQRDLLFHQETDWYAWQRAVIDRLKFHFASEAESSDLANAFFNKSAGKGLELLDLLARRYDVVVSNPPYMSTRNMGNCLKDQIADNYSIGKMDLYLAFIVRCTELCEENGHVAMVTMNKWMFLQTFKGLREDVVTSYFLRLIVDLGAGAFSEISGEVVKTALFVFIKKKARNNATLTAIRLVDIASSEQKQLALCHFLKDSNASHIHYMKYNLLMELPTKLILYWVPEVILRLLASSDSTLATVLVNANCGKTGNNDRFLRYRWEVRSAFLGANKRWVPYTKGGSYKKWFGHNKYCVDWRPSVRIHYRKDKVARITDEKYWCRRGITFSTTSDQNLSARDIVGSVYDMQGPVFFSKDDGMHFVWLAVMNSSFGSYVVSTVNPTMVFQISDIYKIPVCRSKSIEDQLNNLCKFCVNLKKEISLLSHNLFPAQHLNSLLSAYKYYFLTINKLMVFLHSAESVIDVLVLRMNGIDTKLFHKQCVAPLPGGLRQISGKTLLQLNKTGTIDIPMLLEQYIQGIETVVLKSDEYLKLINKVKNFYESGFVEDQDSENSDIRGDSNQFISLREQPAETFLESIAKKVGFNTASIYCLLEEGITNGGWRNSLGEKGVVEDWIGRISLQFFGYYRTMHVEANGSTLDYGDEDGIIPLTEGTSEQTLLERIRKQIAFEFDCSDVTTIEREFAEIMGKTLEQWLETEFFKYHVKQFKKRPIAWQIQSGKYTRKKKPAFACLVYYHKLDGDLLPKIGAQYAGPLRQRYETELRGIESVPIDARSDRQDKRRIEIEGLIEELKEFESVLQKVAAEAFSSKEIETLITNEQPDKWCSIDGIKKPPADSEAFLRQERRYLPDINNGVRVNIAPLQKTGLLAANVLSKKDVDKAIADRAEWRADELRWCREDKLPQPGWWQETGLD